MPVVTLTPSEIMQGAMVGVMRQTANIRDRRRNAHGLDTRRLDWQYHIEGALGEMAFAKFVGEFWSGAIGNLHADDVNDWQVRTAAAPGSRLILHQADRNDRQFVFVRGVAPNYEIVGWILGSDGKRSEFWTDPVGGRAAFFVPDTALRGFDDADQ